MTTLPTTTIPTATIVPATIPPQLPKLTGAIQFSSANIQEWGSPSNPRGYNDAGTPGLRQINTVDGAQAWLNWQLAMLPAAKLQTTAFIFWCPSGDLSSILQQWPIDYASGLEMSSPGWDVIAQKFAGMEIPFGIACRPAENNYGKSDPNNPIHVLWLQRQIERCLKLFPAGAKRVWYCDSVNGGADFAASLGMLKLMREFVGPNDLLLPECASATPDQVWQFIEVAGGCYSEITTATGQTYWMQNASDSILLQKQFPNAQWISKSWGNNNISVAQIRALGRVPLVGDYPGGAALV